MCLKTYLGRGHEQRVIVEPDAIQLDRHARACRGHLRLNAEQKDVDGRNKSGHDGFG